MLCSSEVASCEYHITHNTRAQEADYVMGSTSVGTTAVWKQCASHWRACLESRSLVDGGSEYDLSLVLQLVQNATGAAATPKVFRRPTGSRRVDRCGGFSAVCFVPTSAPCHCSSCQVGPGELDPRNIAGFAQPSRVCFPSTSKPSSRTSPLAVLPARHFHTLRPPRHSSSSSVTDLAHGLRLGTTSRSSCPARPRTACVARRPRSTWSSSVAPRTPTSAPAA